MRAQRTLFWIILGMFVLSAVWWVLYFPYSVENLYRAIPDDAVFVSEHACVASRWQEVVCNPLTLKLLESLGLEPGETRQMLLSDATKQLVEKFGSRNTVVGYVKSLAGTGHPALVVASWAGGLGQFLVQSSWSGFGRDSGLKKVRIAGGRPVWIVIEHEAGQPELSIALAEGMLLVCFSREPTGVRHLVRRIETGQSLCPELAQELSGPASGLDKQSSPDRGCCTFRRSRGESNWVERCRFTLKKYGQDCIEGEVKGASASLDSVLGTDCRAAGKLSTDDVNSIKDLLRESPDAVAVLPYGCFASLLSGPGPARWIRTIAGAIGSIGETNAPVFVSMFGSDMSGRLLGIRIPAFVMGVRAKADLKYGGLVSNTIDRLNAMYGWGLIGRQGEAEGRPVTIFDSTRRGIYASVGAEEKMAAMMTDKWFVFSTCIGSLTSIVSRAKASTNEHKMVRWLEPYGSSGAKLGYLWIDLISAGQAVKNAIAVYSLVLMVQNSKEVPETRERLEAAKRWVDALVPFKTGKLWLVSDGLEMQVHFLLGSPHL